MSSAPPSSAAAGSTTRWSLPSARRARCGVTRPTKPMPPAALTAQPVSTELPTNSSDLQPPHVEPDGRRLGCAAGEHVQVTAEHDRRLRQRPQAARSATASDGCRTGRRAARRPCRAAVTRRRARAAGSPREPAPAATTMPVSNSRVGVQPPGPCASAKTSRQAARAPSAANPSTPMAGRPSMIASSAATDAPPDTPSTYGSASGLRSRTCSIAPDSASRPPTANAASARGSRSSRTTSRASDGASERSAAITSAGVGGTLPRPSDSPSRARDDDGQQGEREEKGGATVHRGPMACRSLRCRSAGRQGARKSGVAWTASAAM